MIIFLVQKSFVLDLYIQFYSSIYRKFLSEKRKQNQLIVVLNTWTTSSAVWEYEVAVSSLTSLLSNNMLDCQHLCKSPTSAVCSVLIGSLWTKCISQWLVVIVMKCFGFASDDLPGCETDCVKLFIHNKIRHWNFLLEI